MKLSVEFCIFQRVPLISTIMIRFLLEKIVNVGFIRPNNNNLKPID